jgi:hypothetical protein
MLSLSLGDVATAATGGPRSFGDLFHPDYAWVDDLDTPARIAIDTRSVHITAPLAGSRFQNRLLALPHAEPLARFIAEHDVDYVVVRIGSPLDHSLRRRRDIVSPVGDESRVQPYRVLHH